MSYSIKTITNNPQGAIFNYLYCSSLCTDLTPGPHFLLRQHLLPQGPKPHACLKQNTFALTSLCSSLSWQLLSSKQLDLSQAHLGMDCALTLVASTHHVPRCFKLHMVCMLGVSAIACQHRNASKQILKLCLLVLLQTHSRQFSFCHIYALHVLMLQALCKIYAQAVSSNHARKIDAKVIC